MRVAHLVMTHKNPAQLIRMVSRMIHPDFDFYIHVDNKVNIDDFNLVLKLPNVTFIKNRINCNWGGNSLLTGIVSALNEIFSKKESYDFINLLSGQDYPLVPPAAIHHYLNTRKGNNFISFDPHRDTLWWKEAVLRYEKYHFTDVNFKWKYGIQKIFNNILPNRKFPIYKELYGSSNSSWWAISIDCAKLIAHELTKNKKLINFIKYSWGTDEFVVATIIMNSEFKDSTINNNLRYIDWSEGKPNPKILGMQDFDSIKESNMLFARKFDIQIDNKVLHQIDQELLSMKQ